VQNVTDCERMSVFVRCVGVECRMLLTARECRCLLGVWGWSAECY
jgi:hypothetical protein